MHLEVGELAMKALLQIRRMVRGVTIGSLETSGWLSGRVSGTAAHEPKLAGETTADEERAFQSEWLEHERSLKQMSELLNEDGSRDMLEWEQRLGPTDMADFPANLRRPADKLDWCRLDIPDPHTPVATEWQPLPAKLDLPLRPAPQGWLTAVRPEYRRAAKDRVGAFQKKLTLWMGGEAERPDATVIPGSWLEYWVFQSPHEFHSRPVYATPVDMANPSKSHLNLCFYQDQGEQYPDQELLSFLVLGVRYKADIPIQIVLQPHLQSFLPVQDKYLDEAARFILRGWTVQSQQLLIVPFFSSACGSVCRPLAGRWSLTVLGALTMQEHREKFCGMTMASELSL